MAHALQMDHLYRLDELASSLAQRFRATSVSPNDYAGRRKGGEIACAGRRVHDNALRTPPIASLIKLHRSVWLNRRPAWLAACHKQKAWRLFELTERHGWRLNGVTLFATCVVSIGCRYECRFGKTLQLRVLSVTEFPEYDRSARRFPIYAGHLLEWSHNGVTNPYSEVLASRDRVAKLAQSARHTHPDFLGWLHDPMLAAMTGRTEERQSS